MNSLLLSLNYLHMQKDLKKAEEDAKVCREIADYYRSRGILTAGVYGIVMRDIEKVLQRLRDE